MASRTCRSQKTVSPETAGVSRPSFGADPPESFEPCLACQPFPSPHGACLPTKAEDDALVLRLVPAGRLLRAENKAREPILQPDLHLRSQANFAVTED